MKNRPELALIKHLFTIFQNLPQMRSDVEMLKQQLSRQTDDVDLDKHRSQYPTSSQNLGFMSGNLSPGSVSVPGSFGFRGTGTHVNPYETMYNTNSHGGGNKRRAVQQQQQQQQQQTYNKNANRRGRRMSRTGNSVIANSKSLLVVHSATRFAEFSPLLGKFKKYFGVFEGFIFYLAKY